VNNQITAFKIIHQWTGRVESGKMDMFSELSDFLEKNVFSENVVKQSITSHLHELCQWFDKYIHEETTPQEPN